MSLADKDIFAVLMADESVAGQRVRLWPEARLVVAVLRQAVLDALAEPPQFNAYRRYQSARKDTPEELGDWYGAIEKELTRAFAERRLPAE